MISVGKREVAGTLVDVVDYDHAVAAIMAAAEARTGMTVTALAVHGIVEGYRDPELRHRLNHFDLVAPDGQPVRWALNLLHGASLEDRVYGPELMIRLCTAADRDGVPIYLYGSTRPVLDRLVPALEARLPRLEVVGAEPSRFRRVTAAEQEKIRDRIRTSGAGLVFVGLGCPRQEIWAYENRDALSVPLVAVGAAFDFHAGTLKQAPVFMQRHGLEWLYRLAREPRRLWRRYLAGNPVFIALVGAQLIRPSRKTSPAVRPVNEMRFG